MKHIHNIFRNCQVRAGSSLEPGLRDTADEFNDGPLPENEPWPAAEGLPDPLDADPESPDELVQEGDEGGPHSGGKQEETAQKPGHGGQVHQGNQTIN